MISFLFSQTILSKLQYSVIKLHIISYLFGDEEQSDGEYLFCVVCVNDCVWLVFKLLLNKSEPAVKPESSSFFKSQNPKNET